MPRRRILPKHYYEIVVPSWHVQQPNGTDELVGLPKLLVRVYSPVPRIQGVHDMPRRRILPKHYYDNLMPSWNTQQSNGTDRSMPIVSNGNVHDRRHVALSSVYRRKFLPQSWRKTPLPTRKVRHRQRCNKRNTWL